MSQSVACRVLLVDDTPEIRYVLRALLGGVQSLDVIGEAKDGREAIHLAQEHQPDVIVLDVSMPVMDGFEALPHITSVAPESTVVMYTAHGSEENRTRALSLGAHHFVEKGGDPTGIVDTVEESCEEG